MWELLKKIAELGWKPYGKDISELSETEKHIRLLTSRSSGLWQFVCKNKLVKPQVYAWYFYREGMGKEVCKEDYEFRLIESALCDEDKLEDFILDNVKIGDI